jgi:hypothetical protein
MKRMLTISAMFVALMTMTGCATRVAYVAPAPRPYAVWVPGHWVSRPSGNYWVAGHWR